MARASGRVNLVLTRSNGVVLNLAQALDTAVVFAETRPLSLEDATMQKYVDAFRAILSKQGDLANLVLEVKYSNNVDGPFKTSGQISLASGDKPVRFRVPNAQWFKLLIKDLGVKSRWHLTAMELFGAPGPRRLI